MLSIAVLEDHDELRELTMAALRGQGHAVVGAYDAQGLEEALAERTIDLLLLDLSLPGEDGLSVARRLKAVMPGLFIIMTTARSALEDRISGYESGADLYLPKPVSQGELLAAVAGVERRIAQLRDTDQDKALRLDCTSLQLTGHATVQLSQTEATLLKVLAQAPGQRVETYRLLEATGRGADTRAKASLEVQIVNLRKKIAAAGGAAPAIRAIRNEGYQLLCPLVIG